MSAPIKITRKSLAAVAADRWERQYRNDHQYVADWPLVLGQLRALGPRPSANAVDEIIGNKSWTEVPACDGCDKRGAAWVIRVGAEPDYESNTAHLCPHCVQAVSALASGRGTP